MEKQNIQFTDEEIIHKDSESSAAVNALQKTISALYRLSQRIEKETTMNREPRKCVHLILSRKWYEMIEAREKKEEYRDITDYYYSRLMDPAVIFSIMNAAATVASDPTKKTEIDVSHMTNGFQIVAFHRGYTDTVMYYNVEKVTIGYGRTEWGAPTDRPVFKIYLDSQRFF